ncbi:MAG TPA: glycine--tRNA ligase [Methanomicrobia archaeon]|nr:glycine--tRNA ligase [Methanomicrobia archaeon]
MKSEEIMEICMRRGFIFPSAEIYGGAAGLWDYGPLGTKMKNSWENLWRKHFLRLDPNFYEISTTNILPKPVFEGSGHLESFNDALAECNSCHSRFRADQLIEEKLRISSEGMNLDEIKKIIKEKNLRCPRCGGDLNVKFFNLMFRLELGAGESVKEAYLRPETAQGAYLAFKRAFNILRNKLPIGLAIIGKSFRNEISPRQGFYRLREFHQAELQIFFDPDKMNEHERFDEIRKKKLRIYSIEDRGKETREVKCEDIDLPKFYLYYMSKIQDFYLEILKLPKEMFRFRELDENERAFYNRIHWDFELNIESLGGYKEMGGIHYRTDHDLSGHQRVSKENLMVNINGKKFIPHVLELSFGIDRNLWALLDLGYEKEEERTVLKLPVNVAPYFCAVFPLMRKEELVKKAKELYNIISSEFSTMYDETGSIGKRYRRQDEIGTPYCITIDYDTLENDTVTLRDRDTMKQERVSIKEIIEILNKKFR